MLKKRLSILAVPAIMLLAGLLLLPGQADTAEKLTLTAAKAATAPSGLTDAVWGDATAVEVPFEGKERFAGKKASVTAKAVYTDDSIFFLFTWKDAAKSVAKDLWEFDGQKWAHQKGNEDRIALLFEIDRINNFATKGCAVTCHVPQGKTAKDGKFGTASDAEKGDLWHWKSARSDPYDVADDTYLAAAGEKTGRKNDAGKGGDKSNRTEDGSKPMYMLAPGKSLNPDGILMAEDAVEITDYSIFKAGDTLTDRLPVKPEGSRGDIAAVSEYANGTWTLMLSRKLDTGHDDDTAFNPQKKYSFAMALFDDSGDENSYDGEVMTLAFGK